MNGSDRVTVRHGTGLKRLLVKDSAATIVSVRPQGDGSYHFSSLAVPPEMVVGPGREKLVEADERKLGSTLADFRFALGIDEDMAPFRNSFATDPLLGPAIAARIHSRPLRRADPWEALAWAITEQLIEYRRAAAIQRRIIRKWGLSIESDGLVSSSSGGVAFSRSTRGRSAAGYRLSTVPAASVIAGAAPAELQACDLSVRRATAMIRVAREVSRGRVNLSNPDDDPRLLAIPEIGPWTLACLALRGRGDADALLAGDLGHVKLVGALAGLGRPAEIKEVEHFYEPYAPFRGVAGEFLLAHRGATFRGPGNFARIRAAGQPWPHRLTDNPEPAP
ncbi:MAG: hypothetical protein WD181_07170 [Solirubrobacterales bacterium]